MYPVAACRNRLIRVAAAGPITGDLVLWLDSTRIVGLSDNDVVAPWSDSSGNGNNATQATTSKKPIYKTGIQNGLPVVRFDGVDDWLAVGSSVLSSGNPAATFFFVVKLSDSVTTGSILVCVGSGSSNLGGYMPVVSFVPAQSYTKAIYFSNINNDRYSDSDSVTANTATQLTFVLSSGNIGASNPLFFQNGASVASTQGTGTSVPNLVASNTWIGVQDAGGVKSGFLCGDVMEILIYNRALSTAERQQNETYLRNKWGTP